MKVCEKVQRKGITSYNEVADELVADFGDPHNIGQNDQVILCIYFIRKFLYVRLSKIYNLTDTGLQFGSFNTKFLLT